MKIKIEIETGNDAMLTWGDVSRAIKRAAEPFAAADHLPEVGERFKIYDANGNVVGALTVSK